MREPSGDQLGFSPLGITFLSPEPSTPMTQMPGFLEGKARPVGSIDSG
jgi:hypothetical protein